MAEQPQTSALPAGVISEYKPSSLTVWVWTILALPITAIGAGIYYRAATGGSGQASGTIHPVELLLYLGLATILTLALGVVHEGVHGIVARAFGARPEYGILKIGGVLAGLYTTTPGHRFSRGQYLLVALAPLAIIAPLGIPVCMLPFGGYLVLPFAIHLSGCLGDATIAWHTLRAPVGAMCEDMRDGCRFWSAAE
jgi:hypothetical protein